MFCRKTSTGFGAAHAILFPSVKTLNVLHPSSPIWMKSEKVQQGLLGGAVAPNKRFVDLTLKIIEFHKRGTDCPCRLYPLSGEDSIYNPKEQAEQGNVSIIETLHGGNSNFAEYSYIAECSRCKRRYKITEKLYHFVCWKWYSI